MMDGTLVPGFMIEEYKYISSKHHRMIGVGSTGKGWSAFAIENIGKRGENLTIAVLSMNRSSLTIRLMQSIAEKIPDFSGEFLIGDNGSTETEKAALRQAMQRMPYRCRMVEFDRNYGVAGGRNRLFREVATEWIFSLDNDIYFFQNPLEKISSDIAQLGCHFLSMPLQDQDSKKISIYGGHLYVDDTGNEISVGGSSAYIECNIDVHKLYDPFLCTFVPGGASIFRKDTFFRCDGFDEGMFVGFEDSEFSMRLFQQGYKIGSCGIVSIIHDHPKPENSSDKSYEKVRFSNMKLVESARYFEKKHGIRVWNPSTEAWVNQRLWELLDEKPEETVENAPASKRPEILLVVDSPGWALDNIAKQIIKYCSDAFSFKIIYLSDVDSLAAVFFAGADSDLIHFLWRPWLVDHDADHVKNYALRWGMDREIFYQEYIKNKIVTTSVYDHLFIGNDEEDFYRSRLLFSDEKSLVKNYSVSSRILKELYDNDDRIHSKPYSIVTDGVDLELFCPQNLERFDECVSKRKLILGWAGNSLWQAEKEDFKGLHTILKPVVEELQAEGYPVELSLCDSSQKKIPHYEMPDWYAGIDLYVCPSKIEGTPNPILECMACGVPFISTCVGIVPEAAGELQSQFILKERSKAALKEKILEILAHPEWLPRLSRENLASIQNWKWHDRVRQFIPMWKEAMENKDDKTDQTDKEN